MGGSVPTLPNGAAWGEELLLRCIAEAWGWGQLHGLSAAAQYRAGRARGHRDFKGSEFHWLLALLHILVLFSAPAHGDPSFYHPQARALVVSVRSL